MNKSTVLDASALLALLNEEPGYMAVEAVLPGAIMSTVNISEVIAVLMHIGIASEEAEQIVMEMLEHIVPFDIEQACVAASLRKHTKSLGLSLGDRACLSLAKIKRLPVLTADKIWHKLQIKDVQVQLIR